MADRPVDEVMDGLKHAVRILAENVGMSTDSRLKIAAHLGDAPPPPPPPPPDPRDVELADLKAQMAGLLARITPVSGEEPLALPAMPAMSMDEPV
jgi:hypothetical protein